MTMVAIFRRKLIKNWLMILGWGVGLGILGFYLFDIYESLFLENININQLLEAFPEDLWAFFGGKGDIFTPEGFLSLEFFSYTPIILGIMVISSASSLISGREEDGTLEVILAQPISRSAVFWSHFIALMVTVLLILMITWAGFALGLGQTTDTFDLTQNELVRPFISLYAILWVFLSVALFLSMILPKSSAAGFISGFLLIASYFITSLVRIEPDLEGLNTYSPLNYYQGGEAISSLNAEHLIILFSIAIVFTLLAWLIFLKRDLRFGGSGGLRLSFLLKRTKKSK